MPSYEIITGNHARGAYYASDLRNVTDEGVEHVTRPFLKHGVVSSSEAPPARAAREERKRAASGGMRDFTRVTCDEFCA